MLITASAASVPGDALAQRKALGPEEYSPGGPCDTSAWRLVFHDEFDGAELDRSKWVTYFTYSDDGSDRCPGCRVMDGTNNVFREEQVRVGGGTLKLGVESKPGTWYEHSKDHEAGLIHSIGNARFLYGRFEIHCRIPDAKGLWPAFWGFGGETEIDVFEMCGEQSRWVEASLHRWSDPKHSNTGKHKAVDLSRDFHTYAVEWEPDEIRWYLDGVPIHSRGRLADRKGWPAPGCDRPPGTFATVPYFPRATDAVNLIVNLAVSDPKGFCKGPRKPVAWPAGTMLEVDHVRVYQRQPQEGLSDLCSAARRLIVRDGTGPLRAGTERRYEVEGPHGDLVWNASPGLALVARDAHGVTVRASAEAQGAQWLRVESRNDPCPRGPLMLESAVEVAP